MSTPDRFAIGSLVLILAFGVPMIVMSMCKRKPTCEVERFNCRPALRAGWDRGPVAYPDLKCDERCR